MNSNPAEGVTSNIHANIVVHSRLAAVYNETEPHFRPENQERVTHILKDVRRRATGGKLLDVGCGTGFIINLVKGLFDEIHGIDITEEMLKRVDTSGANVTLHRGQVEKMPFADASFDVVTAYAFLHHVENTERVLSEVYRVLRPGGIMYIGLDPNRLFWQAMKTLEESGDDTLDPMVKREIDAVLHIDDKLGEDYGLDPEVVRRAEPMKSERGGLDPSDLAAEAKRVGFRQVEFTPDWFLGQGTVMHGDSFETADKIDAYLRKVIPLSTALFKYLRFILVK
jgi:ubiquinone/menaquinone biosynthesis C-methylase UbiE